MKKRVLHIIPGMEIGGSEKALLSLIENSPNYHHSILSLTEGGSMHGIFVQNNISIVVLNFKSSFFMPFSKLVKYISKEDIDVVQTWLYSANIIGGVAAKISGVKNIIWGLRGTGIPQSFISLHTGMIFLGSALSYFIPTKIVSNAESVMKFHVRKGYRKDNHLVIQNGFDVSKYELFTNSEPMGNIIRKKDETIIIGTVGRYDDLKDYRTMISALSLVMSKKKNIQVVMVGRGLDSENKVLISMFHNSGINLKNVSLVGEVDNVLPYYSIMDIFCLSSINEGFPNVVCEAMLMSKPCVVTKSGDSSNILSYTGIVVPVGNYVELSLGLMQMIGIGKECRDNIGRSAFLRASSYFSIERNVEKFSKLYNEV